MDGEDVLANIGKHAQAKLDFSSRHPSDFPIVVAPVMASV